MGGQGHAKDIKSADYMLKDIIVESQNSKVLYPRCQIMNVGDGKGVAYARDLLHVHVTLRNQGPVIVNNLPNLKLGTLNNYVSHQTSSSSWQHHGCHSCGRSCSSQ